VKVILASYLWLCKTVSDLTGNQIVRTMALIAVLLLPHCEPALAQAPPTATEAFNLRIKCKSMADEKADAMEWHRLSVADGKAGGLSAADVEALNRNVPETLGSWHSSKYDAKTVESETHQVYDAQIDDLLANARILNGKKSGQVWDEYKGPWVPPADCRFCMKGDGWDAAIAYMDEIMSDKRQ
jgi:hypothetical protein